MKFFQKLIWLLLIVGLTPGQSIAAEKVIRFGIFPKMQVKTLMKQFLPIARIIEKEIGVPIQVMSAKNRKVFSQRTIEGQYDLIWTCPSCYFTARKAVGVTVIARGIPAFHGIVLVRKDSGIRSLAQLKGKKIIAIAKHSLAGYLFLRNNLIDLGIRAPRDVTFDFVRDPEAVPFKVHNGTYDAGCFSESSYHRSLLFDKIRNDLLVISKSVPIPQMPLTVKKSFDKKMAEKIADILVRITPDNPEGKQILSTLRLEGFEKATDDSYSEFYKLYQRTKNYNKLPKK